MGILEPRSRSVLIWEAYGNQRGVIMGEFGGKQPKPLRRSRVSSGSKLLPNVHEQSVWGRLFRDRYEGVMSHLGGKSEASELEGEQSA
jgi:hypothetical protein